ncbi:uncharacterized protein (DUF2141 family) [Catalinimonas alkaloidigena]|nr:uncharacterized protein (DUF2141 family) [Catalinimonas alkaloidigena]
MIYMFNYFASLALFLAVFLISQTEDTASVNITVEGLKNDVGKVRVAIFNDEATFPKKKPFKAQLKAAHASGTVKLSFDNVPYGEYAIAVYHDENENEELDTNFMGIPKEAYGFSNEHRPKFSGPDYAAAKVKINLPEVNLNVTVKEF